ncbi:MAG: hypothetical protein IH889_09715 [Planctomycetes bacterium]|nr:hypothetical protein [Planctomycetota bacterium]
MRNRRLGICVAAAAAAAAGNSPTQAGDDPFADEWVSYDEGSNAARGYTDPKTSLGPPERFTGEGVFPAVVSAFNPPFLPNEILSIGADGHLVVQFNTPVTDDPANPFGIDLLIFGNTGFIDDAWPNGIVGGVFGNDGGTVEVSVDGVTWFLIQDIKRDGLFPTIGYLDAGPYDEKPGSSPTDFTLPVNGSLTLDDFMFLNNDEVVELYAGSGGGAGIDLSIVGLEAISYVRITNPGDPATTPAVEIDAFSDVAPEVNPADLNQDGIVGIVDLLILLAAWGPCPDPPEPCPADLDGDGTVGILDLLILLASWG